MSILVAGSLHLDVVLRAPHLPSLDETVTGSTVDYVFGGKGGNQAVAAARLGAGVHFIGRAGTDGFGDQIRETLKSSGVDCIQLQQDVDASGMSAAIVNAEGAYGAVIVSASHLNIDASMVFIPEGTSLVLLQNEIREEVNLEVARKAKSAGAIVWLNGAPARALSQEMLDVVDLLIVNRVEAAFYEANTGPQTLVTLGAEGVLYGVNHYPGYVVDVASTHGAGDMFIGALAVQVDRGLAIEQALVFAQAAAALWVASDTTARASMCNNSVQAFLTAQVSR